MRGYLLALFGVLALLLPLAFCSSPEVAITPDVVVVDVRTPQEYADGHLQGAQLLDLNGGLLAEVLPSLDPDATYVVYCRSGNRSAQAVQAMRDAGFTNVTDLGSMERASQRTGVPIVR